MAMGPLTLTPKTIGLDAAPCSESMEQANWNRLPQLFQILQNQINPAASPGSTTGKGLPKTLADGIPGFDPTKVQTIMSDGNGNIAWVEPEGDLVTNITHWRYDTTAHKFQIKTQQIATFKTGAESDWTDNPDGSQPVSTEPMTHWEYAATSVHKFRIKTLPATYALEHGTETAFVDNPDGSQPVHIASVVRNVSYDTGSHILSEDTTADVYALEEGADSNAVGIDTAEAC